MNVVWTIDAESNSAKAKYSILATSRAAAEFKALEREEDGTLWPYPVSNPTTSPSLSPLSD